MLRRYEPSGDPAISRDPPAVLQLLRCPSGRHAPGRDNRSQLVKETLEAIRRLQAAVLLISLVLIALGLTRSLSTHYRLAARSLRDAPRLTADSTTLDKRQLLSDRYRRLRSEVLASALRSDNVALKVDEASFSRLDWPLGDALYHSAETVEDVDEFFRALRARLLLLPDPDVLLTFLQSRLRIVGSGHGTVSFFVTTRSFAATWSIRTGEHPNELTRFTFSASRGQLDPETKREVASQYNQLTSDLLGTVFRSAFREGDVLTAHEDDLIARLAELKSDFRAIWPEIRLLSSGDAIRRAEEIERSGTLSLFGLSISETLVIVGGPLLLTFVLLYLLLHLSHLARIATRDPDLLHCYPWPPLFPGLGGASASLAMMIGIPAIALARFSFRVQDSVSVVKGESETLILTSVLASLSFVVGTVAHIVTRRIAMTPPLPSEATHFKNVLRRNLLEWYQETFNRTSGSTLTLSLRFEVIRTLFTWLGAITLAIVTLVLLLIFVGSRDLETWYRSGRRIGPGVALIFGGFVGPYVAGACMILGISYLVYRFLGSSTSFTVHAVTLLRTMRLDALAIAYAAVQSVAEADSLWSDSRRRSASVFIAVGLWCLVTGGWRLNSIHALSIWRRLTALIGGYVVSFSLVRWALVDVLLGLVFLVSCD